MYRFHSLFIENSPFPKLIPASCSLQATSPCCHFRSVLLLLNHPLLAQAPFTLPQLNPQLSNASQIFLVTAWTQRWAFFPSSHGCSREYCCCPQFRPGQCLFWHFSSHLPPSNWLSWLAKSIHSFFFARVQGLKNTHRDTLITHPQEKPGKASLTARLPDVP